MSPWKAPTPSGAIRMPFLSGKTVINLSHVPALDHMEAIT